MGEGCEGRCAFHSHFAFHTILSASRRPESFYTPLTLSQKLGNTEAQRPQSEMLWFPLWSLCLIAYPPTSGVQQLL